MKNFINSIGYIGYDNLKPEVIDGIETFFKTKFD